MAPQGGSQSTVIALSIVMVLIAVAAYAGRLRARKLRGKKLWWDDWMVLAALVIRALMLMRWNLRLIFLNRLLLLRKRLTCGLVGHSPESMCCRDSDLFCLGVAYGGLGKHSKLDANGLPFLTLELERFWKVRRL